MGPAEAPPSDAGLNAFNCVDPASGAPASQEGKPLLILRVILFIALFPWSLIFWVGWNCGYENGVSAERNRGRH